MEGIRDGGATDDCFYCALLYPQTADGACPRCHNRMHYEPAQLCDAIDIEDDLANHITAYATTPSLSCLELLLTALHRYRPSSMQQLAAASITLEALRARYDQLCKPPAPR